MIKNTKCYIQYYTVLNSILYKNQESALLSTKIIYNILGYKFE